MKTLYVDVEKCMGCKSCELGCAVQHSKAKTLFGAAGEQPAPLKRIFVEAADGTRMPIFCRHCEDAPCLRSCISGCLYRDEQGFIRRHKERCIACWSCVMACPYGVITRDEAKHLAVKCDRCHKLEVPACVSACPTRALALVDPDELARQRRTKAAVAGTAGG